MAINEKLDNFDITIMAYVGVLSVFAVGIPLAVIFGSNKHKEIIVREEIRSYEVVAIRPPKHFNVTLLDVQTHQLFQGESGSKHCNRWRDIKLNTTLDIKTTYFKYEGDDTLYIKLADMNYYFCG